jgi:hypothetical protein
LNIDPGLGQLRAIGLVIFSCAVTAGVCLLVSRSRHDRPPGFCVVYMTSLCFALPVFAFRSPYAAVGGMTIAHGFQYLLLVARRARRGGWATGHEACAATGGSVQRRADRRHRAQRRVASAQRRRTGSLHIRGVSGSRNGSLRDRRRPLAAPGPVPTAVPVDLRPIPRQALAIGFRGLG